MSRGKLCHRVKLRFSRLPKPVRVHDETMLPVKCTAHRLKQKHLEGVKQLTVLGKSEVRVVTA